MTLTILTKTLTSLQTLLIRINLEQTRENLLEHLVTELSEIQPENHLHVRLYQEMALLNIDLAMLNMCNIYNIHADDTYKLFAFAEIQSHINHIYIVGDMLERSTNIFEKKKTEETGSEEKIDSFTTSAS
ncbi:uncharacterized protein LOC142326994 [Lycorma delicatula]|uniref:uncharacterized protein LOC142326994 n=1 Tax=Lycorma delicatula TaxID=130591 RepID=UPI003F514BBC